MHKLILTIFGVSILLAAHDAKTSDISTPFGRGESHKGIAAEHAQIGKKPLPYLEGEVIVKYKKGVSTSEKGSLLRSLGKQIKVHTIGGKKRSFKHKKHYMLIKSKKLDTQELIKELENDPDVKYVGPNYIYYPDEITPNDPYFDTQWAQKNTGQQVNGTSGTPEADIKATKAWESTTGSSDVVIAVTGTGIDYAHEDLNNSMWINTGETPNDGIDNDGNGYVDDIYGINTAADKDIAGEGDPMDLQGHGTHTAGIIAAEGDNGQGIAGNSWHSKLMALKFMTNGSGSTEGAIKCLDYVLEQKRAGVKIVAVNASWGNYTYDAALKGKIEELNDEGILLVASAGNKNQNNDDKPRYPASYAAPNVISVAATDQNDQFDSDYSNYGVESVDLAAPGTNIISTTFNINHDQFFDDMENGDENWEVGGDEVVNNINWGVSDEQEFFDNPLYPVPSPTHFLSDSPGVNYPSNADWWVASKHSIDLSSIQKDLFLSFKSAIYLSRNSDGSISDYAYLEFSKDGGSSWETMFNFSIYEKYWYGPFVVKIPSSYKTSQFRFRFRMVTSANDGKPGWLIDDVGIGTMEGSYEFKTGTSFAAPQVSGAVALAASKCPGEEISITKNRILNTVDTLPSLGWKTVTGGRLNLERLVNSECDKMIINEQKKKYPSLEPIYYLLGL